MTEKEEELLEQIQSIFADDALNEQNVREARSCVDKILEMNPKNGEAYYYQLLLDYGMERMDELLDANMTAAEIEALEAVQMILKYGNESSKAEIEEILEEHRNAEEFGISSQQLSDSAGFMWELGKHLNEVGDGSTYLGHHFQQEYPDIFRKYLKLQKKMVRISDYDDKAKRFGIVGLILTFVGYMFLREVWTDVTAHGVEFQWFASLYTLDNMSAVSGITLWSGLPFVAVFIAILCFVGVGPMRILFALGTAVIIGMAMPVMTPFVIGVVMLVPGIFFFVGSLQYDGAYRKAKALEETYITPFEDKTRRELEEYCRTKLQGHGNVELKGVKHYCQRY